jgi:hypothetical protein
MTNKTFEFLLEILRIGNRAVKKAQDKNRKKGIANVYVKNEKIYFELPNGKLTTVSPF